MNCDGIKKKLGGYLDEELPDVDRQLIDEHLTQCSCCLHDMEQIKKIEALIKPELYEQPPDEYWVRLPGVISKRLGLKPEKPFVLKWPASLNEFLAVYKVQYGFAVAAVAVLIFLFWEYRGFEPQLLQKNSRVVSDVMKPADSPKGFRLNNKLPTNNSIAKKSGAAGTKEKQVDFKNPNLKKASEAFSVQPLTSSDRNPSKQAGRRLTLEPVKALVDLKGLIVRNSVSQNINKKKELIPLPNSMFVMDGEANDPLTSGKKDRPLIQTTAALARAGSPERSANLLGRKKRTDVHGENSFSQTLWIVQESTSLSEQKNIWLSYISREKDPTYHALAIYQLALTLEKIAETTQSESDAREAYNFFVENKKVLRYQMKDQRYNSKLHVLEKMIN